MPVPDIIYLHHSQICNLPYPIAFLGKSATRWIRISLCASTRREITTRKTTGREQISNAMTSTSYHDPSRNNARQSVAHPSSPEKQVSSSSTSGPRTLSYTVSARSAGRAERPRPQPLRRPAEALPRNERRSFQMTARLCQRAIKPSSSSPPSPLEIIYCCRGAERHSTAGLL